MLPHLYTAVANRLFDILGEANFAASFPTAPQTLLEKPLQWVDYYDGQPEDLRDGTPHGQHPVRYPAIFVQFDPIAWQQYGGLRQRATLRMRIYIVQWCQFDSFKHWVKTKPAPDGGLRQQETLDQLLFPELVAAALHNWNALPDEPANALDIQTQQQFNLKVSAADGKYNNVRVDVQEYTTEIQRTLPTIGTATNMPMTYLPIFSVTGTVV